MKKLLIISSSSRILKEPEEPLQAIKRFDGLNMRITRNYMDKLKNVDILILSPVFGFVSPDEKIPYHENVGGKWNKIQLSEDKIEEARKANLATIGKLLSKRKYAEIYINVGKTMLQLMEGLEQIVPKTTRMTYAQGRGIGPKSVHLKNWLELQTS